MKDRRKKREKGRRLLIQQKRLHKLVRKPLMKQVVTSFKRSPMLLKMNQCHLLRMEKQQLLMRVPLALMKERERSQTCK